MLSVTTLLHIIVMAVNYRGHKLIQRLALVAPACVRNEGATCHPVSACEQRNLSSMELVIGVICNLYIHLFSVNFEHCYICIQ